MCYADYEMDKKGFIAKFLVDEQDVVYHGKPIAIIVDKKEDVAAFANYSLDSAEKDE